MTRAPDPSLTDLRPMLPGHSLQDFLARDGENDGTVKRPARGGTTVPN